MGEYVEYQTPALTKSLGKLGYGLLSNEETADELNISPEQAIIEVLTRHPDPRYVKGISVILQKNQINYKKLFDLADSYRSADPNLPNKLGYVLDITHELFKRLGISKDDSELEMTINKLDAIKSKNEAALNPNFRNNAKYLEFAKKKQDEKMRYWNVIGMPIGDQLYKTLLLYMKDVH